MPATDRQTELQISQLILEGRNPFATPAEFFAADRITAIEPAIGQWFAEMEDGEPGRLCEYLGKDDLGGHRVQFEYGDTDVRAEGVFVAA